MSEIEQYEHQPTPATADGYASIRETAAAMADAHAIAKAIAMTDMVPAHFRGKPDDLTAAILYGATLGFDPMQSARQVFVIHGQAGLYARSMAALVLSRGHQVWTVESGDTSVTVAGQRKGSPHVEQSTWTYERARKAGYTGNKKYDTDPAAMLYAKAVSEVCRKIAPDVLNGVYAVEELEAEQVTAEVVGIQRNQPATSTDRLRAALRPTVTAEQVPTETEPNTLDLADAERRMAEAEETTPAGITSSQQKMLGALMREAGITERADALLYVNDTIGREVASRSELTKDEASRVIESLQADLTPDGAA